MADDKQLQAPTSPEEDTFDFDLPLVKFRRIERWIHAITSKGEIKLNLDISGKTIRKAMNISDGESFALEDLDIFYGIIGDITSAKDAKLFDELGLPEMMQVAAVYFTWLDKYLTTATNRALGES